MRPISQLRQWQTAGLNARYGHDPIELFYAKALSNILVACSIVLVLFTVGFLFIDPALVAIEQKFLNTAIDGSMVLIYSYAYYRLRQGFYGFGRKVFVGSSVFIIVFSIMITGGFIESSVSSAIIVIPVLVYLFYGLKAGTIIALLAPIILALQYTFAHFYQYQFPNLSVKKRPVYSVTVAAVGGVCVAGLYCCWL